MLCPEPLDLVIILVVAMLLFGANRLPEIARALGKGIREFKDALTDNVTITQSEKPGQEQKHFEEDF